MLLLSSLSQKVIREAAFVLNGYKSVETPWPEPQKEYSAGQAQIEQDAVGKFYLDRTEKYENETQRREHKDILRTEFMLKPSRSKLPISITALAALLSLTSKGNASQYASDGGFDEVVGVRSLEQHAEEQQPDRSTSKVLSALFGYSPSTPHPTEIAMVMPHQLPAMYYNDFYEDLLTTKRNDVHSAGCDCKVTNELVDLGGLHFPRFLMNAVCESGAGRDLAKCSHGSNCRPLEYKVKVLAQASQSDHSYSWMNKDQPWQFKTVTVTAGCFCTK